MKTLLILFLSSMIYAVDTTSVAYQYIIFVPSITAYGFNKDSFKIGKLSISDAGGQPFRMNRIITPPNTNYYLVEITTNTQAQLTFLNNANAKKCYYKIKGRCLYEHDGMVDVRRLFFRALPPDINRDWSVDISTH